MTARCKHGHARVLGKACSECRRLRAQRHRVDLQRAKMSKGWLPERFSKVERLAIAAQVAPTLRAMSKRERNRPIHVVDAAGNVIRTITTLEMQLGVLERAGIELDPGIAPRPAFVVCMLCARLVATKGGGSVPLFCRPPNACRIACYDCHEPLGLERRAHVVLDRTIARCFKCYHAWAKSPQGRAELVAKRKAKR